MKVVHIACVAPPQIGGIGRVASVEVHELQRCGIDASLLTPADFPVLWSSGNAAVLHPKRLASAVRDADIVHLHYPFYGTAEVVSYLRKHGSIKHLVITLHMDATASGLNGLIFGLHRKLFQHAILNQADALCVSSKDYAAHSSFAPWVERTIELPFGVDTLRFSPKPGIRNKTVVFVGGLDRAHAFKGVDILLRACAQLPRDTRLIIAGDGDLRHGYEKYARDLGLSDRVTFLGRVSDADLPDVYRQGSVFAFPSISSSEAFGLVALEAQACGIPVVASYLPGVRTVIEDKITGLLTPSGDSKELAAHLRLFLENSEMCEEFGHMARARVLEQFTWIHHIDGLMKIYLDVCASRS